MKILIDTNFILTCIKQRLDFFSKANEIIDEGIEWLVPAGVIKELEMISKRKGEKIIDKESAAIALEMLRLIEPQKIELDSRNVDQGIVNYAVKNNIVVATLDRGIKKKINKKILTIKDIKSLEII